VYNRPVFRQLRIAVVIPAYNEGEKIAATVASVPDYVDEIYVIDDASADDTSDRARDAFTRRATTGATTEVIRHAHNRGVGAAIGTGYRRVLDGTADVAGGMAGEGRTLAQKAKGRRGHRSSRD